MFWVHKSSENLMKFETYSAEGNIVETQKFILEKSIPSSKSQLNIPNNITVSSFLTYTLI